MFMKRQRVLPRCSKAVLFVSVCYEKKEREKEKNLCVCLCVFYGHVHDFHLLIKLLSTGGRRSSVPQLQHTHAHTHTHTPTHTHTHNLASQPHPSAPPD